MITAERLRQMLDYDPATGVFTWRVKPCRNVRAGDSAGAQRKDGYWRIGVAGEKHLAHRLAWLHVHGRWPDEDIDHINGDPGDNRLANLRECSRSQNLANRRRGTNNASGHKGVFWCSTNQKWAARLTFAGKQVHLGLFGSLEDASAAYARGAREHYGEFYNCGDSAREEAA